MQRGFTKLFNTIVTSTIWQEDDQTRIVWITMLAIADRYGIVSASIPGLASVANVKLEAAEKAIKNLSAPDEYSRTRDHEGRRIEEIEGGWHILNYEKYRRMLDEEERKAYKARWIKEKRRQMSTSVDASRPSRHIPSAFASEKGEKMQEEGFDLFWQRYPNKQKKLSARSSWDRLRKSDIPLVMDGLEAWIGSVEWQRDGGQFIPHPATFLNQRRWEDRPRSKSGLDDKLEREMRETREKLRQEGVIK